MSGKLDVCSEEVGSMFEDHFFLLSFVCRVVRHVCLGLDKID